MSPSWHVRRYRSGDESGINDLFRRVFGKERTLEEWRWKFMDRPVGLESSIHLLVAGDRIVGHFALIATRLKCGDGVIVAVQSVDNMIDPDYRRGLRRASMLKAAFRDAVEAARERGIALGYGFPNRENYRVGTKLLGYRDLGTVDVRLRSLTWARHVRRLLGVGRMARLAGRLNALVHKAWIRIRTPRIKRAFIREAGEIDGRFDRLWETASRGFSVLVVRDSDYLSWRYRSKPGAPYRILTLERAGELVGYVVVAITVREGAIRVGSVVDLLTLPEKGIAEKLLAASIEHFLAEGADLAECWDRASGPYSDAIRRLFPRRVPRAVHAVYQVFDPALEGGPVTDPDNWYITMGDADGI